MLIRRTTFFLLSVAASSVLASVSQAALTTSPYLFTEQAIASTGQFEWDEFTGDAAGPHAPDVASSGGSAELLASGGLVTGTQNIYSFGGVVDYTINLSGLDNSGPNTTVVAQLSATGALDTSSFLLDGTAPTTVVERGKAAGVLHNTDDGTGGVPFDSYFYWAEWQVAADTAYSLEYSNVVGHVSNSQARVDYFNDSSPFLAVAASPVPEPTTLILAGLSIGAVAMSNRRRR